jgi:sugar lactone lactonase YvrE
VTITAAQGVNQAEGVAVDADGGVWIANNGLGGSVTHCVAPFGASQCTSFNVPGALWLAVFPSAIDP